MVSFERFRYDVLSYFSTQSYNEQSDKLAGPIGLLKQHITRTARETAEDATQIFGGRGITATGMGRIIENVRTFVSGRWYFANLL